MSNAQTRRTFLKLSAIGATATAIVDLGPGLFTGLRVGVAAGKALSNEPRCCETIRAKRDPPSKLALAMPPSP